VGRRAGCGGGEESWRSGRKRGDKMRRERERERGRRRAKERLIEKENGTETQKTTGTSCGWRRNDAAQKRTSD
jgi:hypothetical protein